MKLLVVTYRWGEDLVGGAEIHHRRLVHDLLELGHEVEVWTTTGREIAPAAHWAVEWTAGYPEGMRVEAGVPVRRFRMDAGNRRLLQVSAKYLQRQIEREWAAADPMELARLAAVLPEARAPWVHLLEGWHPVELCHDGTLARWTFRAAHLAAFPTGVHGELWLAGKAPHNVLMGVQDGAGELQWREVTGDFEEKFLVRRRAEGGPDIFSVVVDSPWRPLTDHRTLGVYVQSVRWMPAGSARPVEANLWNDHRAIGRRHPEAWWDILWRRSMNRPERYAKLFDWLRGPRSSALARALRTPDASFDAVLAANLPWSVLPMVARECPLPLLAMALWHIEDDFYYWPQYVEALRRARVVLANTPYSAERFFAPRGIRAEFVGPGVPLPDEPAEPPDARAWKHGLGIADDEAVVLSVSRKSPEKRYDVIAEAVERLNAAGRRVRFVLVGPDMDCRVVPPTTLYLGRIDDAALDRAYRCCDLFALMSDSESFGMVLAEAWLRGRPVIANAICGPAASLVSEGQDGLLAQDAESLARAIATLLDDPDRARRMGEAGRVKARRDFTQRAATERFLAAAARALGR
jgi:glycosyltransferase involved in cell wall biosynthesis